MHVATTSIDQLVDYLINTPEDGLTSSASVQTIVNLVDKNDAIMQGKRSNKVMVNGEFAVNI